MAESKSCPKCGSKMSKFGKRMVRYYSLFSGIDSQSVQRWRCQPCKSIETDLPFGCVNVSASKQPVFVSDALRIHVSESNLNLNKLAKKLGYRWEVIKRIKEFTNGQVAA